MSYLCLTYRNISIYKKQYLIIFAARYTKELKKSGAKIRGEMLAQPEALIYAAENLDAQLVTGALESRQALENAIELHIEQKTGRDTSLNRDAHLCWLPAMHMERSWGNITIVLNQRDSTRWKWQWHLSMTCHLHHWRSVIAETGSHPKHTGTIWPVQRQQQMPPPATAQGTHIPGDFWTGKHVV